MYGMMLLLPSMACLRANMQSCNFCLDFLKSIALCLNEYKFFKEYFIISQARKLEKSIVNKEDNHKKK